MLNTINNDFFEKNPNKVLGEFSIAPYMNKIIVKGSKEDVEKYFANDVKIEAPKMEETLDELTKKRFKNLSNKQLVDRINKAPDFGWDDEGHELSRRIKESEGRFEAKMVGDKIQIIKDEAKTSPKQKIEPMPTPTVASKAPEVEKEIIHIEGFKILTIQDTVKKYSPELSDNDIKAFVWYNQTIGVPMTGWEKWFIVGSKEDTVKAISDIEYLNQQFKSIGKFQKGDVIGKATKFTHNYNGIPYVVYRKLDGHLVIVDSRAVDKSSSASNVSIDVLKPLLKSSSLYYINGDYVPLHVYSNTDYEILKSQLDLDKAHIVSEFGEEVYEKQKSLIVQNQMRVDAPKFEDRFKLNPFSEIARTTKAGIVTEDIENEDQEKLTVGEAFEQWISELKNSDFQLVSKDEFRRIIIWESKQRFFKDEEDEKEAYKTVVANAQLECVRLFSDFCANVLDTETKTALNREINLVYNRSILINTSKVPVGFVCSNKFKSGGFSLKPVQVEAFKFAVSRNNWCLALTVGFGKTTTMISLLSYFITSGSIKKPLIVVPKPVLVNWIKEMTGYWLDSETKKISFKEIKGYKRMYGVLSECGIDVINIRNLDKRHRIIAKDVAKTKKAITLCTYEALEKMYIGSDEVRKFIIEEWKTILSGERNETAREWAGKMLDLENKLNEVDREADIDIQELGFDSMFVDEAHRLKNMFVSVTADKTNRVSSSFKGSSSSRALRGFYISMYLQKAGGRIGFLTATPFSNTPLEVYTMLCFLGYKELTKNNVNKITKFVELFFNETTEPKVNKDNRIVYQAVMKNYKNKGILNTLLSNTFLYKDNPAEAGLSRPCIIRYPNNDFKLMLKMSPIQKLQRDILVGDFISVQSFVDSTQDEELKQYAEQILNKYTKNVDSKNGKAMAGSLVASSKISALSPFAGSPVSISFVTNEWWSELYSQSPKIRFTIDAIRNMMEYQKGREETPASFLIYCEVGLNILPTFKQALEEICGFKRRISLVDDTDDEKEIFDEVEIIEGSAGSDKEANRRDNIQTLFNLGKIKVIIGTSTIKEGLNLQENCPTLFILTPSWNSTDIAQVEGRIHRQGNRYGYARVITPVVARSMDSFIYQKYDEKRSRLADIWKNDGKSDTEDLNIEIKADKQKELILDNASEIGRIRGDMKARVKTNIYNKSKEDYESIKNAIRKSGEFSELLNYHLDKTSSMLNCAKENLILIKKLLDIIKEDSNVKSSIRNLKVRLENLVLYYDELIEDIELANTSKEPKDVVNIMSRSYDIRTYYITDNYDTKLDLKEYFIENGFKRGEIENLFENDIFEKVEVYTKMPGNDPKYDRSLRKLKDLYGSSVMAEKLLLAEGLSMSSKIEDLDALVEKYKDAMDSIVADIRANFEEGKEGQAIPKKEYVEKLIAEAQFELDEENKYAQSSDELGDIFSNKTNPQLTYLKDDIDLSRCEIKYAECCDTNGRRTPVEVVDVTPEIVEPVVPTKPTKEVLQTRLKIVKKMFSKNSLPTLATRIKIIEKMLKQPEKFCCGGRLDVGGVIPNNYEGTTPSVIWNDWTEEQKAHFLSDHSTEITGKPVDDLSDEETSILAKAWKEKSYFELSKEVKDAVDNHIATGQYKSGGAIKHPEKIKKVMGEFKRCTLKSSSGKKVTDKKQAIAIALAESRK